VKQLVAGKGNADKRQVAQMIRALLALEELPRPDAADALALAVTHCRRGPIAAAIEERLEGRLPDNPALALLLRGKKRRRGGVRRTLSR
jgi:hypothetical protein